MTENQCLDNLCVDICKLLGIKPFYHVFIDMGAVYDSYVIANQRKCPVIALARGFTDDVFLKDLVADWYVDFTVEDNFMKLFQAGSYKTLFALVGEYKADVISCGDMKDWLIKLEAYLRYGADEVELNELKKAVQKIEWDFSEAWITRDEQ